MKKSTLFKPKPEVAKRLKSPKGKGNSFENKIAKELSLWITDGKKKDVLMRAPTSGARSTVMLKVNQLYSDQAGDIVAVAEEGVPLTKSFIIECKHRKDLVFTSLLFGREKSEGLLKFWLKLVDECCVHSKHPLLIARQNNSPIIMGCTGYLLDKFELRSYVIAHYPRYELYMLLYDDFIEHALADVIKI